MNIFKKKNISAENLSAILHKDEYDLENLTTVLSAWEVKVLCF